MNTARTHRRMTDCLKPSYVKVKICVTALACFAMAGCADSRNGGANTNSARKSDTVTVVEVIDGDTIDIRIGGRTEHVRLIGIDTPETKHPRKPVQCYGHEASAFTTAALPVGTQVRIERDVEARDTYDRLLAYIFRLSDDMFINLQLARQGYARVLAIEPNTAYLSEFVAAANEAKTNNLGLWQACR